MTPSNKNIYSSFKKAGIYPSKKQVVKADKFYPAELFREDGPI